MGVTLLLEEIRVWLGQKVSPKLFSSCKRPGEFWDIFDHTQKWSGHFLGVVKNVPESPCYNYYV